VSVKHATAHSLLSQPNHNPCCAVDFGMSFVMDPNQTCVSACRYGTATHMAPEALMDGELSKSSDVYSFGIILAELTSGPVFKSFPLNALTQAIVFKHLRPCFPDDVPAELRSLAERCWRPSPSNRPPFQEILIYLLDIKENFCTTKQYDPPTALVCLPPVVSAYAEEDCGEIHSLGLPFILDAKDAQDAQESQAKVVFASCSDTEFS
jgi:serine/threonine protein kinase